MDPVAFSQRVVEIKEQNAEHILQLTDLQSKREQAPERLRSVYDSAIENLETIELDNLQEFLSSEDVEAFVQEQAAQARGDIATIENLASQGLITDEQRQQHISELFESESYAEFLALLSTAQEVFDESNNPFQLRVLLATPLEDRADSSEEDTTETRSKPDDITDQDEDSLVEQGRDIANDPPESLPRDQEELEIIELAYNEAQNKFIINGVELDEVVYRRTVQTRLALIRSISSLPAETPTKPGEIVAAAKEIFWESDQDDPDTRSQRGFRHAMQWVINNIRTPEGTALANHNNMPGRGAKIWRTLGVSATTSFASADEVQNGDDTEPDNYGTAPDSLIDQNEPSTNDQGPDNSDTIPRTESESHSEEDAPYDAEQLISPQFREHLRNILEYARDKLSFYSLSIPESLQLNGGSTSLKTRLELDMLQEAARLIIDSIEQSNDFISMQLELIESDDAKAIAASNLLEELEELFQSEGVNGYVLPAHIEMAVDEIALDIPDEHEDIIDLTEELVFDIDPAITNEIEETVRELLKSHKLEDVISSLSAVKMVGLKTRDVAMARDAGVIKRGNSERQSARLTIEKLVHVFAYSKLRHMGITAKQVNKLVGDIIAAVSN